MIKCQNLIEVPQTSFLKKTFLCPGIPRHHKRRDYNVDLRLPRKLDQRNPADGQATFAKATFDFDIWVACKFLQYLPVLVSCIRVIHLFLAPTSCIVQHTAMIATKFACACVYLACGAGRAFSLARVLLVPAYGGISNALYPKRAALHEVL